MIGQKSRTCSLYGSPLPRLKMHRSTFVLSSDYVAVFFDERNSRISASFPTLVLHVQWSHRAVSDVDVPVDTAADHDAAPRVSVRATVCLRATEQSPAAWHPTLFTITEIRRHEL